MHYMIYDKDTVCKTALDMTDLKRYKGFTYYGGGEFFFYGVRYQIVPAPPTKQYAATTD